MIKLKRIKLINFCGYKNFEVNLSKNDEIQKWLMLYGPNGSYKSTFLDAVFLLSSAKSFQSRDDLTLFFRRLTHNSNYQPGFEGYDKNETEMTIEGIFDCDGVEKKVPFDRVLLALGRKANVTGFGLEELGVEVTGRGTIETDGFLATNFPNIYAVGDVAGPYQFTHAAAHQAWYASVNALFGTFKRFRVDYRVIPWATFTDPEVARVGLNEKDAKEKGIPYEITTYGIDDLDRAIADSSDEGSVKILTVPGKDKILGVTIVGKGSGDLIPEFILAMKYNLGLNKILGTIHIYPTMSESNKYAAGNWKRAHAPEKLLSYVEKFHTRRRG